LPSSYEGEVWLERVDPVLVVAAVPGRIEPAAVVDASAAVAVEPALVPFAAKHKKQRTRKLPRILRRN
jgi:cellulase/cellobiase CelA1